MVEEEVNTGRERRLKGKLLNTKILQKADLIDRGQGIAAGASRLVCRSRSLAAGVLWSGSCGRFEPWPVAIDDIGCRWTAAGGYEP